MAATLSVVVVFVLIKFMPCPFSHPIRVNVIAYKTKTKTHYEKKVVNVPCGKCHYCRNRKASQWEMRIQLELLNCISAYFVTFTYDDIHLPLNPDGEPCFSKSDIQKFFKRLRKKFPNSHIKYLLVSEYGDKDFRPHYHAIIFNIPFTNVTPNSIINDTWCKGFCTVSNVAIPRVRYLLEYYTKTIQDKEFYSYTENYPFLLASKRPSIGCHNLSNLRDYINRNHDLTIPLNGRKYILSDYHQRKLVSKYNKSIINQINRLKYEQNYTMRERLMQISDAISKDIRITEKRLQETSNKMNLLYQKQLKKLKREYDIVNDSLLHATFDTNTNNNYELIKKLKTCLI